MTDVAAQSSNTLVTNGGQTAPDGIPADGTGEYPGPVCIPLGHVLTRTRRSSN